MLVWEQHNTHDGSSLKLCVFLCLCVWQFGFRKWKSHVTERPFQDRSEVVKELYSELNVIKPHSGTYDEALSPKFFRLITVWFLIF